MALQERATERLLKALEENVPAPAKVNFMVTLSGVFELMEGNGISRIDVFNAVYAKLHEEQSKAA